MGCGASSAKRDGDTGDAMERSCTYKGEEIPAPNEETWTPAAEAIEWETAGDSDTCIIVVHGFMSSGKAMRNYFESLIDTKVGLRCVCPTAPSVYNETKLDKELVSDLTGCKEKESAATIHSRLVGTSETVVLSWYNKEVKFESVDDMLQGSSEELVTSMESGHIKSAIDYIKELIRAQIKRGIKPEKIVVIGHGQGAFIAARAVLTFEDAKLGGLGMIMGYLGGPEIKREAAQDGIPILVTHGKNDLIVTEGVAESSKERLKVLCPKSDVQYEAYAELDHFPWKAIASKQSELGKALLSLIEKCGD